MQPIYSTELVWSRDADDFDQRLATASAQWEDQNVDVDVQFSTSLNNNAPLFAALLVVRRRENG